MQIIPLEIIDLQGDGYHLLIDVKVFNQSFKMVVDTGASKTVLDINMLLNTGISKEQILKTDILSSGLGTNNMESFLIDLPVFSIKNWNVQNLSVAVLDLNSINQAYEQMGLPSIIGVLGGDILYKYGAQINYKKQSLTLNDRQSPNFKKPPLNT